GKGSCREEARHGKGPGNKGSYREKGPGSKKACDEKSFRPGLRHPRTKRGLRPLPRACLQIFRRLTQNVLPGDSPPAPFLHELTKI
ncbi:MAG: hypothetical protein RR288_04740, partial [Oscillibacter sp.]